MHFRSLLILSLFAGSAACGDDSDEPATTAEPTAEQAPTAETPTTEKPEEQAPEEPAGPSERPVTEMANHLPALMSANVALPANTEVIDLGSDFFQMTGPAGTSIAGGMWQGGFRSLTGAGADVAVYQHNPAGDDGEDCPTLETILGRLGDAEIVTEQRASHEWEGDGPAYGNEIDLLIFTRDGRAGFFVRKMFDHGDDYTDMCAAFGAPETTFDMTATGTIELAKSLAASFLTARENL